MKKSTSAKINYWEKYDYPENKALGARLSAGDIKAIIEMTQFSKSYVEKIFVGVRHNDLVVEAAREILACRKQAADNIKKKTKKA